MITNLFNAIFTAQIYPDNWSYAKLTTVFKKGDRSLPSNYRGISVMNSLAKLFDMVLCARLTRWFTPLREQAGAQAGRGCVEHIVALRLVTDYARRKKKKLFVTFVDYAAAYDRVPRAVLFDRLRQMGCGSVMLGCLVAMYSVTRNIVGSSIMTASAGVRQGSPSSCLLFVLFLNDMVKLYKERCANDGFLGWLHVLVLMDDTVIMATSRRKMIEKLRLLKEFCAANNMKINLSKTKFMTINGVEEEDKSDIVIEDLVVKYSDKYVYLGSIFKDDGKVSTAIEADAKARMCQSLKFISFVEKNNDMPFHVKLKVFDACVTSGLLYGCESYVGGDLRSYAKLHHMCVKALLGVRTSTNNDLCLIEIGRTDIQSTMTSMQRKFLRQAISSRQGMADDPLMFALRLSRDARTHTSRVLNALIEEGDVSEILARSVTDRHSRVEANANRSSRLDWYNAVNPGRRIHDMYSTPSVDELHRISWTRLRLSAHSLAIEEGRWNRRGRGRLPIEERLCGCGRVQSERHVIEECPETDHLRARHGFTTVDGLMNLECATLARICHVILMTYS